MSPRGTKNDRTITLTNQALEVYDSWPHMEKSKKVSQAIIKFGSKGTGVVTRQEFEELEKKVNNIINRIGGEGV
jgi:nitrate reductase alpha subunit